MDGVNTTRATVGRLLDLLEATGTVATRRVQWVAVAPGRLAKVCTFCGHRATLDVLDIHDRPMEFNQIKRLAAELTGAPHVCKECSQWKTSPLT